MVTNEFMVFDCEHGAPIYTLDEVCGLCRISVESVVEFVGRDAFVSAP